MALEGGRQVIEDSFFAWLDATVSLPVYPAVLPQGIYEGVCYYLEDDGRDKVHGGGVSSLQPAEFEVRCWSRRQTTASSTSKTIMDALVNFNGTMGTHQVSSAGLLNRRTDYETDSELRGVILRFLVHYEP